MLTVVPKAGQKVAFIPDGQQGSVTQELQFNGVLEDDKHYEVVSAHMDEDGDIFIRLADTDHEYMKLSEYSIHARCFELVS